jgi:hypothetical protein
VTPFWYVILTVGIIAGVINLGIAFARRKTPMLALIRLAAAIVSFVPVAGIIVGKSIAINHPFLQKEYVVIGAGVFIFFVLFLPSAFERRSTPESTGGAQRPRMTMAQRAARPANATVRLRDARSGSDEWVN